MASLSWCKKQKLGIKLIEPNNNLSKEYLSPTFKIKKFKNPCGEIGVSKKVVGVLKG